VPQAGWQAHQQQGCGEQVAHTAGEAEVRAPLLGLGSVGGTGGGQEQRQQQGLSGWGVATEGMHVSTPRNKPGISRETGDSIHQNRIARLARHDAVPEVCWETHGVKTDDRQAPAVQKV
jgi:hypothetical protein